jgi:tetratricopeptide (TPR) repeat protein
MPSLRVLSLILVAAVALVGPHAPSLWAQHVAPDRTIQFYQRLLQRQPRDATTYYRLGDAYIQKARETGDITYVDLAEQALRKCLEIAPDHSGAARHLAYALYSRHAFEDAAAQAAKAIALNPLDSHAYGILGDAHLEVGRYDPARQAYQRMMQLRDDLYAYSRLSGLKSLQGDPQGAIADLERAIQSGQAEGRPPESIAWVLWQLGNEYAAVGKLSEAEAKYLQALDVLPQYYRALAGLAHVRAAQQRYAEAIGLYQQALAIIPLPDYAAALGDVYAKAGQPEAARKYYDLVEYIGYLSTLNKALYNRELAYFYADHDLKLPEALDLARRELEVRKDIYAYDVLAWALYKNDRPQEALPAMTEALKLGTQDARLFFHAGMIYHRLGDAIKAQEYLRRALTTNPHFHVLHASVAERTLGEIEARVRAATEREKNDERR